MAGIEVGNLAIPDLLIMHELHPSAILETTTGFTDALRNGLIHLGPIAKKSSTSSRAVGARAEPTTDRSLGGCCVQGDHHSSRSGPIRPIMGGVRDYRATSGTSQVRTMTTTTLHQSAIEGPS